jgi:hypothetical protein
MIVEHGKSSKPNKRFYVKLDNGEMFDYGFRNPETGKTGKTFIDGATVKQRENYWKRHIGNRRERQLIKNLIPSPALFSAFLLWGPSSNFYENIDFLDQLLK